METVTKDDLMLLTKKDVDEALGFSIEVTGQENTPTEQEENN